jgi:hypothetical protein
MSRGAAKSGFVDRPDESDMFRAAERTPPPSGLSKAFLRTAE